MNDFRKDVAAYINNNTPGAIENSIAIMGKAVATAAQMKAYILTYNKDQKWQFNETGKFKITFDSKNLKIKVEKLPESQE